MKAFVFVRGPSSDLKKMLVDEIMQVLNPDINHVRAFRISIEDYHPTDANTFRAANKSCKNLVRKVLGGNHSETFIVIDNENLRIIDWQSYYVIANGINVNAVAIGVDFLPSENLITEENKAKYNLQLEYCDTFKSTMYKYYQIKSKDDLDLMISELKIIED